MSDPKPTEAPELTATTQKLPAIHPLPQEDSDEFVAQQEDVRVMIAANDPLSEVLTKLVLMIEAQAPNMLASILLLSYDGNHVHHAVAPAYRAGPDRNCDEERGGDGRGLIALCCEKVPEDAVVPRTPRIDGFPHRAGR